MFGLLCLIVSAVGLYGVLAQAVALRTREIAIRMALGAARTRTMRLVLGDAMMLVGLALVPGLAGAVAAGRLLNNMLYESAMLESSHVGGGDGASVRRRAGRRVAARPSGRTRGSHGRAQSGVGGVNRGSGELVQLRV